MSQALAIWTVYDHPRDYPDCFVARKTLVVRGGPQATNEVLVSIDLAGIRTYMRHHRLTCIARADEDDPVIVEVWL